MAFPLKYLLLGSAPLVLLVGIASQKTLADGDQFPPLTNQVVAKECSACHMLYQAGLLPAASWDRMLAGLVDHFGENASVEPEIAAEMRTYLMTNAARPGARTKVAAAAGLDATAPLRITSLDWFVRKHRKGRIAPEALQKAGAKSASACQACHKDADKGDYGD